MAVELGATTASLVNKNTVLTAGGVVRSAGGSGLVSTGESRIPNPLHDYALYNYLFSLSVLSDEELNNATYKTLGPSGPFLSRSASMTPEDRIETVHGKYEYFIEDVRITHAVGFDQSSGNTNALGFSFKIIEPYSMGLFFQALQTEAQEKGHPNYLTAPLLLTLNFKGHKTFEDQMITIPNTTKYFPLKLLEVDMKVTERGSVYDVTAYPYNEFAFEKSKVTLTTDISIVGKTVEEMLKTHPKKSLEFALNNRAKEQEKDSQVGQTDQYEIIFPPAFGEERQEEDEETGGTNEIAKADLGFKLYDSGKTPFAEDNFTYENGIYKRGNISINPKESEFNFAQGSDVINAINQVILMSEYGRNALKNITADGFVKWWRVEVELKNITTDKNTSKTGNKPYVIIYRVVPYMVDSSYFLPPNEQRKGTELDKLQVAKEYNYVYTGKNIDILNFDINFKAGFYTVTSADGNQDTAGEVARSKNSTASDNEEDKNYRKETQDNEGKTIVNSEEVPTSRSHSSISTETANKGGLGNRESSASTAARQFYDAISTGVDMITVDMTILGDPYYIGDSGLGNYHAGPGESKYVNDDGSMPWDHTEIHILLNFRTPVDNGAERRDGLYDFGNVYEVKPFSGLYRIFTGESNFVRGKFTQTLNLKRLANQNSETGEGKLSQPPEKNTDDKFGRSPSAENTGEETAQGNEQQSTNF